MLQSTYDNVGHPVGGLSRMPNPGRGGRSAEEPRGGHGGLARACSEALFPLPSSSSLCCSNLHSFAAHFDLYAPPLYFETAGAARRFVANNDGVLIRPLPSVVVRSRTSAGNAGVGSRQSSHHSVKVSCTDAIVASKHLSTLCRLLAVVTSSLTTRSWCRSSARGPISPPLPSVPRLAFGAL